jgi:DNA recombination protein RmuC
VYRSDTKERASLLKEMQNLQSASDRINTEAENLTKALKGDNKIQGNWGELVLERILEDSGLRKDHEYFVQPSSRDEQGRTKRPDIVIRLPEGKDVVVDSKVTLVAYEQVFMKQHVEAVKGQIKKLAEQDYDQLPDLRSLDFVLLFIPIESAFTLAMELDPKLFVDAFNKRIMLVSPTTLMMALRIIDNLWQVEKQNRNAQDIAQRAGALYDKLQGVVEEVDKLGKQLGTVQGTYDTLYGRLAGGRGNLVGQAEKLRELGAPVKKPITPQLGIVGDSEEEP